MSMIWGRFLKLVGALTLLATVLAGIGFFFAGTFLTQDDIPSVADAIVVLGGDYRRPMYAADLYKRGYATSIYVGRVIKSENELLIEKYGFSLPVQDAVYYRILTAGGVPPEAIRLYGTDLCSTLQESENLAARLGDGPGRLIVVTSPTHVMRARMIFKHSMPGWTVMVCSTPYESFPQRWWSSQETARNVLLESAKTLFYLLGGGFRSSGGVTG